MECRGREGAGLSGKGRNLKITFCQEGFWPSELRRGHKTSLLCLCCYHHFHVSVVAPACLLVSEESSRARLCHREQDYFNQQREAYVGQNLKAIFIRAYAVIFYFRLICPMLVILLRLPPSTYIPLHASPPHPLPFPLSLLPPFVLLFISASKLQDHVDRTTGHNVVKRKGLVIRTVGEDEGGREKGKRG